MLEDMTTHLPVIEIRIVECRGGPAFLALGMAVRSARRPPAALLGAPRLPQDAADAWHLRCAGSIARSGPPFLWLVTKMLLPRQLLVPRRGIRARSVLLLAGGSRDAPAFLLAQLPPPGHWTATRGYWDQSWKSSALSPWPHSASTFV